MRSLLLVAASAVALSGCVIVDHTTSVQSAPITAEAAPVSVSAGAIEAHIRFLADDRMEGRMAGEPGYELAANYVEAQYRQIGLLPGGDDGYRAGVPLQTMTTVPEMAGFSINGQSMTPGEHFIVDASAVHDESAITADAVFVGNGIVSETLGVDAYAGVDVRGKIVVVLAGTPDGIPSDVSAHLNSDRTKAQFAADAGAIGLISIPTEGLTRWTYERMAARAPSPSMTTAAADAGAGLQVTASISDSAAEALFASAPQSFADTVAAARAGEEVPSFDLGVEVSLSQGTSRESFVDDNVVGILPGNDPELADEIVVVTAHLDHVGVCRLPDAEDNICNGALDNASGTSIMIETARALAEAGGARRSVAFVALAAEEQGLLGSAHIAQNPPAPMANMVANINLDMPVIRYRFNDLIAFGAEHSSLGPIADAAVQSRGLSLTPDPMPQQALFVRSDHYNFVRDGVPSLFLMTGFSSRDAEDDDGQGFLRFLGGDYHGPGDEVDQVLFEEGAKFANLNYEIIATVANGDKAPSWNEDSFFNQ
ncbi:M28 family metallopeptidase [Maricaulaceae bacterium EIL42A08]|nr:M28 family metallopeptidase [Maricaulaceae bacterium EIL42A08]